MNLQYKQQNNKVMNKVFKLTAVGALAAASMEAQASVQIQNVHTQYVNGVATEVDDSVLNISSGQTHVGAYGNNIISHTFTLSVGDIADDDTMMIQSAKLYFNDKFNSANVPLIQMNDITGGHTPTTGDFIDPSKSDVWAPPGGTGSIFLDFAATQGWSEGDDELLADDVFGFGESMEISMLQMDDANMFNGSELMGIEVEVYNQDTGETTMFLAGDTSFGSGFSGNNQSLPEPSSMLLVTLAALPLIMRRKRC